LFYNNKDTFVKIKHCTWRKMIF